MISLLKKHTKRSSSRGPWDKELAPAYKLQHPPFSWHRKSKAWESAQGQIGSRNQQASPIQAQNCPAQANKQQGPVKAPDGSSRIVPAHHRIKAMRADCQEENKQWHTWSHIYEGVKEHPFTREEETSEGFKDSHLLEPRPSCHCQCLLDQVSNC